MKTNRRSAIGAGCVAVALMLSLVSTTRAALIAGEAFDYTPGLNIHGLNGGTGIPGWGSPWYEPGAVGGDPNNNIFDAIAANSLSSPGLLNWGHHAYTGGKYSDIYRDLASPLGTPGTVWVSFLLRRDIAGTDPGNDGNDYGGLTLGQFDTNDPLFIGRDEASGKYTLSNASGLLNHPSSVSETLGATALLVAKIIFTAGNDTIELFVDPTPGVTPTTPVTTKSDSDLGTFTQVAVLAGSRARWSVDEIRIANTYQEATPTPEPGSIGVLVLAAIALLSRRGREVR